MFDELDEIIDGLFTNVKKVSINEIVDYVNEKTLSLNDKIEIIKATEYYLLHLNPNQGIIQNKLKLNIEDDLKRVSMRAPMISHFEFHQEMIRLFASVRDLHAKYFCRPIMGGAFGFLGFVIRECFNGEKREPMYIISEIHDNNLKCDGFDEGAEIVSIDGESVLKHARDLAKLTYSTNEDCQLQVGLRMITYRDISEANPAYPKSTIVKYKTKDSICTKKLEWNFFMEKYKKGSDGGCTDEGKHPDNCVRNSLWSKVKMKRSFITKKWLSNDIDGFENRKYFPDLNVLTANCKHQSKDFGYLKILEFQTKFDISGLYTGKSRTDMMEICRGFPSSGLIIDVRGNPGGFLHVCFQILEWISDVDEFVLYKVRNSSQRLVSVYENNKICLSPSEEAMVQATNIGEQRTAPIEYKFKRLNLQVYKGPIIVLVDSFTCSAAEIFASFITEYGIGKVIGVDARTPGSTASVTDTSRKMNDFSERFSLPDHIIISGPYEKDYMTKRVQLGNAEEMTETITKDIEHVGVKPDERYFLTKDDILHHNVDLFNYIASNFVLNDDDEK